MTEIDPTLTVICFLVVLLLQLIVARKHVGSILDPLLYFIVTTSLAMSLAVNIIDEATLLIRIFLYFLSFWCGFLLIMGSTTTGRHPANVENLHVDGVFPVVMTIGIIAFIVANLFAWHQSGIPILSNEPSLQKTESFTGGLGFVRRYNWGVGVFLFTGSIYWFLFNRSRVAAIYIAVVVFVTTLGASKSAFLPAIFALGLYLIRPFQNSRTISMVDPVRRSAKHLLFIATVPVLVVLALESEGIWASATAFMARLFYFGDVIFYWNNPDLRQHFMHANTPLDYPFHLFGSFLGALRIISYEAPLGNQFVQYSLSTGEDLSRYLGPNTPFYVKGELFFGASFAPFYAAAIGASVAAFRRTFIRMKRISLSGYSVAATLLTISMTLPTEDSLFMGRLGDFFIFFVPVFVLAKILLWSGRPSRHISNEFD